MIVSKIAGGLGNQMFQYAATLSLSKEIGVEFKIDLSWFERNSLHNGFELDKAFNIKASVFDEKIDSFSSKFSFYIMKGIGEKFLSSKLKLLTNLISINEGNFDKIIRNKKIDSDLYMLGYWQSEEFFINNVDVIRSAFKFNLEGGEVGEYEEIIKNSKNPVSVHIRRGDYVSHSKTNQVLGVCSKSYYINAVKKIEHILSSSSTFFVFSDDLEWAKENFKFIDDVVFVDANKGSNSYLDMYLMSLCKHHIIANSSFSWWGAWLAKTDDQIVIAPTPWFNLDNSVKPICSYNWHLLDKE